MNDIASRAESLAGAGSWMPRACAHSVRFTGQAYYLEHVFAIQSTLNGYTARTPAQDRPANGMSAGCQGASAGSG